MKSFKWYLQRLSAMSPAEIPWRARRVLSEKLGRFKTWPRADAIAWGTVWDGPCDPHFFRDHLGGNLPFPSKEELTLLPGDWNNQCLIEAEYLLKHEFTFFAFEYFPFGETIDWNCDYSTGRKVAQGYAPDIDYRNPKKVGDVKYAWEPARLQHLVRLAQAWRYSQDERFPREIINQITDFIAKAPFMMSVHWTSGIEVGLRLISLTWAFHLIRDYPGLTAEFCSLLVRSISQHLEFVDHHYSAYSSANNHLVAEASGACFAATYWKNLKKSEYYRARAKKRLVDEIDKQVFDDGVGKEQTFGYSFFVWDLWLLPALLGENSGDSFPLEYWDRLRKMADFLDAVSDESHHTPNVGDEDGGYAVLLEPRSSKPVAAVRHLLGSIPQLNSQATCHVESSEKSFWISGKSSCEFIPADSGKTFFSFPNGGYHVIKHRIPENDEFLLVFDAGSLGYPATAVHGHADALSIWLHINGYPVLVDPGTYSYQDTPDRYYFKATSQHNTLSFGDQSQAEYVNRFIWGKKPHVKLEQSGQHAKQILLNGFVRWFSGETHRRKVLFDQSAMTITLVDSWNGNIPPTVRFHFAPNVRPQPTQSGCTLTLPHGSLHFSNSRLKPNLETYQFSSNCYHKIPSQRLVYQADSISGESETKIIFIHS